MEKIYFSKNLKNQMAAVENLNKMRIKCICWQWYPFFYIWVIYHTAGGVLVVCEIFVSRLIIVLVEYFSILNSITQ